MRKHSFKGGEYRRVEVITGQKRRRDWTAEEKAEILAATMVPGASVTEVARRFSIGPTLVWTWRRKAMGKPPAKAVLRGDVMSVLLRS
jgi:transposase